MGKYEIYKVETHQHFFPDEQAWCHTIHLKMFQVVNHRWDKKSNLIKTFKYYSSILSWPVTYILYSIVKINEWGKSKKFDISRTPKMTDRKKLLMKIVDTGSISNVSNSISSYNQKF